MLGSKKTPEKKTPEPLPKGRGQNSLPKIKTAWTGSKNEAKPNQQNHRTWIDSLNGSH